jgi:hypothetical protein
MAINNFSKFHEFAQLDYDGASHFLQIIKRKKDLPNLSVTKSSKIVKTYTITSLNRLEDLQDEIMLLCQTFSARAYISISSKNEHLIGLAMIQKIAHLMQCGGYEFEHIYAKTWGSIPTPSRSKKFLLDIDDTDPQELGRVITYLQEIPQPPFIHTILPTPNGHHIITSPFPKLKFKETFPQHEIKNTDSPTILYSPFD